MIDLGLGLELRLKLSVEIGDGRLGGCYTTLQFSCHVCFDRVEGPFSLGRVQIGLGDADDQVVVTWSQGGIRGCHGYKGPGYEVDIIDDS